MRQDNRMGMGVLNFWLSIDNWHQAKNPLLSDNKFSKDISVPTRVAMNNLN